MKLRLFPINKLLLLLPVQIAVVIVLLNAISIDRENVAEVIIKLNENNQLQAYRRIFVISVIIHKA